MWQPVNLTEVCPNNNNFTACTLFGYIFLDLLTKLYGGSIDDKLNENFGGKVEKSYGYEEYTRRKDLAEIIGRYYDINVNNKHLNAAKQKEQLTKGIFNENVDFKQYFDAHMYHRIQDYDKKISKKDSTYLNDKRHNEHLNERVVEDNEYDFIVVGAGTAGCIVANRLTENKNWKVLLLEAGPEEPDITRVPSLSYTLQGSNVDWGYTTQPDGKACLTRNGRCGWPRGKMMGGSSSINTLLYIRGNRADYDGWASMGNTGWSYHEVLPYFKKSENNFNVPQVDPIYHGTHGEQDVSFYHNVDKQEIFPVEAFREIGLQVTDFNAQNQIGTGHSQSFTKGGVRISSNSAFIRPIRRKRKNLSVKTNSEATKILIDENKVAYGIKYIKNDKIYTAIAKKEVIISAGSVNSPKLIMLSGIGPRKHLENLRIEVIKDLPVGENLHDHVTFDGIIVVLNSTNTLVSKEEMLKEVIDYKFNETEKSPLSKIGPLSAMAFVKINKHSKTPDVQYDIGNLLWKEYLKDPISYDNVNIFPSVHYDAFMPRITNLVPKSRGRLLLNSTHPYADPLIYANYYEHPEDLELLVKAAKILLTLEKTKAFKSNGLFFLKYRLPGCKNYSWGSENYFRCLGRYYTKSPYHPVGSCKMGPRYDKTAVVDPKLRVYGVSGLRVIDASIMPVVPTGNTNAPTMMVAEKGVDMVKEHWVG